MKGMERNPKEEVKHKGTLQLAQSCHNHYMVYHDAHGPQSHTGEGKKQGAAKDEHMIIGKQG